MKRKIWSLSMAVMLSFSAITTVTADEVASTEYVDINKNESDEEYGVMRINETYNEEIENSFTSEDGTLYVPVREVFEKLGYEIEWIAESKTVILSKMPQYVTFSIGVDGYTFARTAPQKLGAEPVIKDNKAYVPVAVLTDLLNIDLSELNGSDESTSDSALEV